MRRITTLVVLIALFSLPLLATESSSSTDVNVVASADQAKPAAEVKKPAAPPRKVYAGGAGETGGWLFKSVFGEGLQKKTGIQIENLVQMGCSTNTATDTFAGNLGNQSWPDPVINDNGCTFQDIDMMIHRDYATNILPGVGPIPGPMPKKFDWGFYQSTLYGRSGASAAMSGFDKQWAINDPAAYNPTFGKITKSNLIALPNVNASLYIPVLKGMALRFGRFGTSIGWDIPPAVRPGPDWFGSKTFALTSIASQQYGLQLSANVIRNPQFGYLTADFSVNNGYQTYHPVSGKKNFGTILQYRTPKMATGVKVAAQYGPKNILPGAACTTANGLCSSNQQGPGNMGFGNFFVPAGTGKGSFTGAGYLPGYYWVHDPTRTALSPLPAGVGTWGVSSQYLGSYYHVISPRDQQALEMSFDVYHNFGAKWKVVAEGTMGKQYADGKSDTLFYIGPNHYQSNYTGGAWWTMMGQVAYQWKKNVGFGLRGEHVNNQDGTGMYPVCSFIGSGAPTVGQMANCKTDVNEITANVRYEPSKFIMIWPEIRYDWQSNNHGLSIWGLDNLDVAYLPGTTGSLVPLDPAKVLAAPNALTRNNNGHTHRARQCTRILVAANLSTFLLKRSSFVTTVKPHGPSFAFVP